VEQATDGADALSKLKEFKAEVMFLDITMPVMDGVEVLQALRSDETLKDIDVIVLSAVSEKDTVAKVMSMGVLDYMLKPLLYEHTYSRIKEFFDILRKKKKTREDAQEEEVIDDAPDRDKFLIITTDTQLVESLKNSLKDNYKVLVSDNGAEGLKLFMKYKPKMVVLGEHLPLLNEKLFATKVKPFRESGRTKLFAIKEDVDNIMPDEKDLYDYIITSEKSKEMFS
jgi:DNA-binding response OmpR family regulator